MASIKSVDATECVIDIRADWSITPRTRLPGPPERIDGMTFGVVAMAAHSPSPHNGEMHPDGDEIIHVITGKLRVSYDSEDAPLVLSAEQTCIIPKGEWHKIDCLEDARFIHITPGPNGEARFE